MSGAAPSDVRGPAAGAPAAVPPARSFRRRRWGTALGLTVAVLFLGVAEGFPLVTLPLGVLLIGLWARQRWWWLALAALIWVLALTPGGSVIHTLSRGWGLLLGGAFLSAALLRPRWSVFARSLAAIAVAFLASAAALAVGGGWSHFDATMAEHFRGVASFTSREVLARFPDAAWAASMAAMADRLAGAQTAVFPALLALQSLAALALAWWAFDRSRGGGRIRPALRPLREFRFHDGLVWVVVAGLALLLLPLGDGVARLAYNLLLFMGGLYVLRGIAVFVFLARGAPTAMSVVLGVIATLFFYPIVFTAALLVGLGDTWLDVRGRVLAAARA